ncbi:semaphorin-4E [Brachyhypopomus gauderio]|uniref:semaphorin-4E n=1 Tax=Brachyhypopomus gauderio TaxID=698409 RepID=UPI004042AB1C
MLSLLLLCVWVPGLLSAPEDWPAHSEPRKNFSLGGNGGRVFREQGVWNYSTMLLREDLGLLILGAREAIFALELSNITHKRAMVKWQVTGEMQERCSRKGKNLEIECQNYIRILHRMRDGRMYVCGTSAFSPTCDIMSYTNDTLTLEDKKEDGKGKCPFDPFQRYASELVDGELFSATSINFLGSEPVMMRSSAETVRTEFKTSWLNEPNFIGMEHIAEGEENPEGDDDKIYLFFVETAVEYDFYNRLEVSRVARVCKSDMGGQRTLQRKWTSFVKARLDCPVRDSSLPLIMQDVFRFCPGNWSTCVFYAVFTPQDTSHYSAVCAYKVTDIGEVFSHGKFKTPVTVETSFVKWVMYSGDLPFPRPGACINNEARDKGFLKSLDLPDKTLQFIRDRPLMDQAVLPINERPLLVKKGPAFTRIVVARTTALDGSSHEVMFIGTESGSILKAVNYDGEMVIIEEMQVFQQSEPVKILRLSLTVGLLYAGSEVAAGQVPLSSCRLYPSCLDCVLARDPYCGWDLAAKECVGVNNVRPDTHSQVVQSLMDGDASRCPLVGGVKAVNVSFLPGFSIKLQCQPGSNLAQVQWHRDGRPVVSSDTHHIHRDGLVILNASASAAGRYTCGCVESSHGRDYVTQNITYDLRPGSRSLVETSRLEPRMQGEQHTLVVLQVMVVVLSLTLAGLMVWNFYKGHFHLAGLCRHEQGQSIVLDSAPRESSNSNNNHNRSFERSNAEEKDGLNKAHT